MNLEPVFRLRGKRDYLHSASLFDDLLRLRGAGSRNIDMRFHRRTNHQVSYQDTPPGSHQSVVAEWADAAGRVYVIERDQPITDSEPYDEPALVARLTVEGRHVAIPSQIQPFSRIEAIIAGFKRLLQDYRGTPPGGQYAFVRVRLEHCPDGALDIHYARDIGDFLQGDITVQGQRVGQIFFGVWQ